MKTSPMKKNNMIASLIFLSSICMLLSITRAAHGDSSTGSVPTSEKLLIPPTPDPRSCKNLKGKDPKDPLLNVPAEWRPDYARTDPCWTPKDDKNCKISNFVSKPDEGFELTFTCLKCTTHIKSGPTGKTSNYSCN